MSHPPFVPADFVVPRGPTTDRFRLEPLTPDHNAADHAAWATSITHIRATPGYTGRGWPPEAGMTPEENLGDLRRHARDFERRTGFTYSVIGLPGGEVIGCVYIYPVRDEHGATSTEPGETAPGIPDRAPGPAPDATVRSWVRADRADLDRPLYEAVRDWLAADWPFRTVAYAAR
ncbi:GNAT family N-acetyltransferase [Streptomyces sp. Ac-502]|uniref:GNAT family N-acetyltransferase n=1 Tax=Streptomyces sp. Ac-502 TaxID=3342801 RepID=UPI003862CD31